MELIITYVKPSWLDYLPVALTILNIGALTAWRILASGAGPVAIWTKETQ